MTAALILSGGRSQRMGQPKALLKLDGETFLAGLVRRFRQAGLTEVVVVGGAHFHRLAAQLPLGVRLVEAADWRQGMRASLRAGLRALPPGPVLLTHVDRPRVAGTTLAALARADDRAPLIPTYRGVPGHPVRLPAWLRARLLAPDAVPLRAILAAAGARAWPVDDPDILLNVNAPADLARLQGANPCTAVKRA